MPGTELVAKDDKMPVVHHYDPVKESIPKWSQPDKKQLEKSESMLHKNGAGIAYEQNPAAQFTSPPTPSKNAGPAKASATAKPAAQGAGATN